MANTLHILTKQKIPSEFESIDNDSAVVLTQDAVYLLLSSIFSTLNDKKIFALASDLQARGIEPGSNVEVVDYQQLVNLVIKYSNNVTW